MNAKKQKKELPSFQLDTPRYFILNLFLVFQMITTLSLVITVAIYTIST